MDKEINNVPGETSVAPALKVNVGDKVYFDAWLAAKFPGEKDGEHYWLIKWEHVRAIENAER